MAASATELSSFATRIEADVLRIRGLLEKSRFMNLKYLLRAANQDGDVACLSAMDPACDRAGEGGDAR